MKTKILIEIKGGSLQYLASNTSDIDVFLIDWDNIEQGQDPPVSKFPPDSISETFHHLYKTDEYSNDDGKNVYNYMKENDI